MPRVVPSLETLHRWIPWRREASSEARAAALRTASLWQGREFLLLHVDATKPTHTVADGIASAMTIVNATISEELLSGYFSHALSIDLSRSNLFELSSLACEQGLIRRPTFDEIQKLRTARNDIAHADRNRAAIVTSLPLDSKQLSIRSHSRIPTAIARELRAHAKQR